jgi:protein-L-isoaspartate(D-aspartate) O-methyltransferase
MMTEDYAGARERLLAEIDQEVRHTARWLGVKQLDPAVREAMARAPRHEFVSRWERDLAYENRPLSIGHGQTISQPYIVAAMTQMLHLAPQSRVLEIGTGCGYQTAVLAEIAAGVWSVERIGQLAEAAARLLARLGYRNIQVRAGDGYGGWPEEAPFDAIIVTAAADAIPQALLDQLAPGGRMVIPVGGPRSEQVLTLVTKAGDGGIEKHPGLPVAFVPLVEGRKKPSRVTGRNPAKTR